MPDDRLPSLLALNAHLVAMEAAGVPLDFGKGPLRPWLERLEVALSQRMAEGCSIEEAVAFVDSPPLYRRMALAWLDGKPLAELLEHAHASARDTRNTRSRLTLGLAYPAIVVTVACLGLALLCWNFLPLIESAYADLREPVSPSVAWLQMIRSITPIWLIGAPLAVAFGVLFLRRATPPRLSRSSREVGAAARRRLARECRDPAVSRASMTHGSGVAAFVASQPAEPAPPLLAWARTGVESGATTASDFRAVAEVYDDLAQRGADRFSLLTPMVASVVLGGGATLLYGLALFVPVVELLWDLAF